MLHPFRSSRLIYRAVEGAEDAGHFLSISRDSSAAANSSIKLLRPAGKKTGEQLATWVSEETLLGVVICLPPPSSSSEDAGSDELLEPTPIGFIFLRKPGPDMQHHRNSMIGLQLIPEYRGRGYGSEAIRWIVDWGFRTAGLHRIEIGCFSWNEGAMRLYPRLGFTFESRKREALWFNGGWHDLVEFAMLEHEWRARESPE